MPFDEQWLKGEIGRLGERLAAAVGLNQKRAKYYSEVDKTLKPLDPGSADTRYLAQKAMARIEELERTVAMGKAELQTLFDAAAASYAVMISTDQGGGGRDPDDPVIDLLRQELERIEPILKAE